MNSNIVYQKDTLVKSFPKWLKSGIPKDIAVVSVSPKKSQEMNNQYRKKDRPTNVLSFRYSDEYGEILLCPAVIRREAREQGNSFKYQMTWMIVHGMLHLSGLHHEESRAAEKKFSRIEKSVLVKIFNGSPRHHHRN